MKKVSLKVPKKIKEVIETSDYKRKDDLYTIIDLIYRRQSTFTSRFYSKYLYVNIPIKYFKQFISKNEFINNCMEYLEDNGIIEINGSYSAGRFPRSYRISSEYLSTPIMVELKDKTINKKYNAYRESLRAGRVKNNQETKKKYLKEFQLDYDAAYEATIVYSAEELKKLAIELGVHLTREDLIKFFKEEELGVETLIMINNVLAKNTKFYTIINNLNYHQHLINNINNSFLYFKRNETNGRLDSNLSNLPTYLRKFIKTDKELYHIDISNSQPYFLYCTLKGDLSVSKEELERYGMLVTEGKIYEYYATEWNKVNDKKINREQAKKSFFRILFSKVTSYQKEKEVFAKSFPTIMEWVNEKNEITNNVVAIEMSSKESFTILDVIKPKLIKDGINTYTIHDSFICFKEEVDVVVNTVKSTLEEMYNEIPTLHINKLIDEVEEEIDYSSNDDYDYGDLDMFIK